MGLLTAFRRLRPARDRPGFAYRSRATFLGLPLLAVSRGVDPATGRTRVAAGLVAVAGAAVGVVLAVGGAAIGRHVTGPNLGR